MILGAAGLENHPDGTGDVNPIVNANWAAINNLINPGRGFTASQDNGVAGNAGNKIRTSAAFFDSRDVGAKVVWADGSSATISAFVSNIEVTASDTKLVTSQAFEIYKTNNDPKTGIARGLVKVTEFVAGDDAKIPVFDNALGRFKLATQPGFGVTLGRILFGGGASSALASSADLTFDDSLKRLTVNGEVKAKNVELDHSTIASAASIALDFLAGGLRSINTLAHNVTFTTSNRAVGRSIAVRIVCDGTTRTFSFPAGWKFLSMAAPANIAANKTGVLSLTCFGSNDSDIVAVWAVEP
jgi:hypothetical protein